jgi:hypothetical protein
MNCYEWQHQISLSGMSISANCSYEIEDPFDPTLKYQITISGEMTYPDASPPYARRGMRCGIRGGGYAGKQPAFRAGHIGLNRFTIIAEVQPNNYYPLEVNISSGGLPTYAGIRTSAFTNIPLFLSGLYKPEDQTDPFYACGFGVWSKSKDYTSGAVFVHAESDDELLVVGLYERIEPGGQITYYRLDDLTQPVGGGTMSYTLTTV